MKAHIIAAVCLLFTIACAAQKTPFRIRTVQLFGEFSVNSKIKTATEEIKAPIMDFGINSTFGGKSLGMYIEGNYKSRKLSGLPGATLKNIGSIEGYLGLRYFPVKPTIMAGKMAIRPTFGAAYGIDFTLSSKADFTNYGGLLFAGFTFTPITSLNGFFVNVVYRTDEATAVGYQYQPYASIRAGLLFGPSANK